jgi:hypothetical protein
MVFSLKLILHPVCEASQKANSELEKIPVCVKAQELIEKIPE